MHSYDETANYSLAETAMQFMAGVLNMFKALQLLQTQQ